MLWLQEFIFELNVNASRDSPNILAVRSYGSLDVFERVMLKTSGMWSLEVVAVSTEWFVARYVILFWIFVSSKIYQCYTHGEETKARTKDGLETKYLSKREEKLNPRSQIVRYMLTTLGPTSYGPRSVIARIDEYDVLYVFPSNFWHVDLLSLLPIDGVSSMCAVALKYLGNLVSVLLFQWIKSMTRHCAWTYDPTHS